jgi:hypothetical protein
MRVMAQRGLALVASRVGSCRSCSVCSPSRRGRTSASSSLPHSARLLVVLALPFLFAATLAGIAAGFPLRYVVLEAGPLNRLVADDVWRGAGVKTAQRVAEAKLEMLKTSRQRNRFKGWALIVGFCAEAVAVALVAAAVAVVL